MFIEIVAAHTIYEPVIVYYYVYIRGSRFVII